MVRISYAHKGEVEFKSTEVIEEGATPWAIVEFLKIKYALLGISIVSLSSNIMDTPARVKIVLGNEAPKKYELPQLQIAINEILAVARDPRVTQRCPDCGVDHDLQNLGVKILNPESIAPYDPVLKVEWHVAKWKPVRELFIGISEN